METKRRGGALWRGREEGQDAGNASEKEAPRKVQSHTGDRMEDVEGISEGRSGAGKGDRGAMLTDRGCDGWGL